ncbi:hypothetical protein MRX96_035789 [Rhipicephalus microplus]
METGSCSSCRRGTPTQVQVKSKTIRNTDDSSRQEEHLPPKYALLPHNAKLSRDKEFSKTMIFEPPNTAQRCNTFKMKFTSAILIVALAAALLAAVIAAEEITASGGGGTGSGCPDTTACTKSCKKQGYSVGICLEPLLTNERYTTFKMKFTPAILIVALAAGTGSGCPDTTACTKSCKKQGYSIGICLEPLLTVCACL